MNCWARRSAAGFCASSASASAPRSKAAISSPGWQATSSPSSRRGRPQPRSRLPLPDSSSTGSARPYLVDGHLIDIAANVGHRSAPCRRNRQRTTAEERGSRLASRQKRGTREPIAFSRRRWTNRCGSAAISKSTFAAHWRSANSRWSISLRSICGEMRSPDSKHCCAGKVRAGATVSPLEFIPVAEEIGIINSIGEWVLRTSCIEAATWPGAQTVSVNVSAIQFKSPNLVATIMSALAESGLDPRRLELEVTESIMLDPAGRALAMLQEYSRNRRARRAR